MMKKTKMYAKKIVRKKKPFSKSQERAWIRTGIAGFDDLLDKGIPRGASVLVTGGAGSGKTIFCLQLSYALAKQGMTCLYMSLEESEDRLVEHMRDFGWHPEALQGGRLLVKRFNLFDVITQVDAMLEKARGELLIDLDPLLSSQLPAGFKPDVVVLDSLSAVAAAFTGKPEAYRAYLEQLFRILEKMKATSFLVVETSDVSSKLSPAGVEEFLADGVIVFYRLKSGNLRERAIEVFKLRGAKHQEKIALMRIESGKGIVVYPEEEVFEELPEKS